MHCTTISRTSSGLIDGSDDIIAGGGGNDILVGGDGRDYVIDGNGDGVLDGGSGFANQLRGGCGDDTYVIGVLVDTIVDFRPVEDRIVFLGGIVRRRGGPNAAIFAIGTGAGEADDRFLYDRDGTRDAEAEVIAYLSPLLGLVSEISSPSAPEIGHPSG